MKKTLVFILLGLVLISSSLAPSISETLYESKPNLTVALKNGSTTIATVALKNEVIDTGKGILLRDCGAIKCKLVVNVTSTLDIGDVTAVARSSTKNTTILTGVSIYESRYERRNVTEYVPGIVEYNETVCKNTTIKGVEENSDCSLQLVSANVTQEVTREQEGWFTDWYPYSNKAEMKTESKSRLIGFDFTKQSGDNVDLVPVIKGVSIDSWAWWNGTEDTSVLLYACYNGTFLDGSGNNYTLNGMNGALANATGKFNKSCYTDGSNDYIMAPNVTALEFEHNQSFSVFLWFKTSTCTLSDSSENRFIHKQPPIVYLGAYRGWFIQTYSSPFTNAVLTTGTTRVAQTSTSYCNGAWNYIGFTNNGTSGNTTLYVNGTAKASSVTALTSTIKNPYSNITLGRRGNGYAANYYERLVIFNRTLTPTEVNTLFLNGGEISGGPAPPVNCWTTAGLVTYIPDGCVYNIANLFAAIFT